MYPLGGLSQKGTIDGTIKNIILLPCKMFEFFGPGLLEVNESCNPVDAIQKIYVRLGMHKE